MSDSDPAPELGDEFVSIYNSEDHFHAADSNQFTPLMEEETDIIHMFNAPIGFLVQGRRRINRQVRLEQLFGFGDDGESSNSDEDLSIRHFRENDTRSIYNVLFTTLDLEQRTYGPFNCPNLDPVEQYTNITTADIENDFAIKNIRMLPRLLTNAVYVELEGVLRYILFDDLSWFGQKITDAMNNACNQVQYTFLAYLRSIVYLKIQYEKFNWPDVDRRVLSYYGDWECTTHLRKVETFITRFDGKDYSMLTSHDFRPMKQELKRCLGITSSNCRKENCTSTCQDFYNNNVSYFEKIFEQKIYVQLATSRTNTPEDIMHMFMYGLERITPILMAVATPIKRKRDPIKFDHLIENNPGDDVDRSKHIITYPPEAIVTGYDNSNVKDKVSTTCSICFDSTIDNYIKPCNHACSCLDCLKCNITHTQDQICPICKNEITTIVYLGKPPPTVNTKTRKKRKVK